MMASFHELVGIALAHETAARLDPAAPNRRRWLTLTIACVLAVGSHGVLDALPHYYPLPSVPDAAVSIALVLTWLVLMPRWMRWPLLALCTAALLPDIIDHVPKDLRRHLHLDLPIMSPLFPWHWLTGSGSLRGQTGPLWRESVTYHVIVLAFCTAAIVRTRHLLAWRSAGSPPAPPPT
jgi:hypothetical protein